MTDEEKRLTLALLDMRGQWRRTNALYERVCRELSRVVQERDALRKKIVGENPGIAALLEHIENVERQRDDAIENLRLWKNL